MMEEYSIEKGLDDLLKVVERRGDCIIPIARRGIRVLERSPRSQMLFDEGMVLFYDVAKLHSRELKNKRIILFDEGVNTGDTLNSKKQNLQRFSIANGLNFKISTAALLVNRDARNSPDYYPKNLLLNSDLYDYRSQELHYKILSDGKPLDVDHLILKIKLSEKSISNFMSVLQESYNVKELSHSGVYEGVLMFTMDFSLQDTKNIFPFDIPNIKGFPKLFDVGPKKIRFFIKDNHVYIVPIIYPAMETTEDILKLKENCPFLEVLEDGALCEVLKDSVDIKNDFVLQSTICYNCMVNRLNLNLLSQFLVKLKQQVDFDDELELDARSIQMVSHSESKKVIDAFNEIIRISLRNNEIIPMGEGKSKECTFEGISLEDVSTIENGEYMKLESREDDKKHESRLRPEVEVSMAVNENKDKNMPLFVYGEYNSTNPPPEGLSYSQIYKMMTGMGESRFSEGMDVALDAGYLKPVMPFEGVNVFYEHKIYRAIVRLYTTASEDVSMSLGRFLRAITQRR
jgi:hypothetical protein